MEESNAFINEQAPEIASALSMNSYYATNAPARSVMSGSHFASHLVISGSEPKPSVSGVEEEMGRFTFATKMPEDGTILTKISRYGGTDEIRKLGMSPETLVIYQSSETGEIGCFKINYFTSHDPVFGFKNAVKDGMAELGIGADIKKGTVFTDTPANKGDHHYTFTKNLNVAYMSVPNVGLDGYVICEDVLPSLMYRIYERRTVEFGSNSFLLNTFGDDERYAGFPEIGEYIKESGLLCVVRKMDGMMAPALTSRKDVQRIDYDLDNPVFARPGKGRVVDITVTRSNSSSREMPPEMTEQLNRYHVGCTHYYRELVRFYDSEVRRSHREGRGGHVKLSRDLHAQIVYAKGVLQDDKRHQASNITYTYRNNQLDTWRVSFVIEYECIPNRGSKITCENGGYVL